MTTRLPPAEFEGLVAEALESIPPELAARMSNVEIVVELEPGDEAQAVRANPRTLLGLYQGVPLTERGEAYYGVLPDRILLYQRNIERAAATEADIREVVRVTVIHEVAHHFGIGDDRLAELGWA